MQSFPDESQMDRSQDGSDPIRGGSIGFNRVLGYFVDHAAQHRTPAFNACLISAFTIYRNIFAMDKSASIETLEQLFIKDLTLFLQYYDTYLDHTKTSFMQGKKAAVIVYFPQYGRLDKDIRLEPSESRLELFTGYNKFLKRFSGRDEMVREMEHLSCFWIRAGDATYPHKELSRKLRDITAHPKSLYTSGDPISLISHIPLDFHLASRVRNLLVFESYTGKVRPWDEIRFRIDKDGFIPFNSTTHGVLGDRVLIKPLVSGKVKREILAKAKEDKWLSRTEEDIRHRIAKIANLPIRDLRKFDFV